MSLTNSAKRSYRKRVRSSHCRRKGPAACRGTKGCKYSSGKKRSFCRKTKNTKRRTGIRTRAMRKQKGGMLDNLMNKMKAMVTPSPEGNKLTDPNNNKSSGIKSTDNKSAGGNKAPHTNNKSPHADNKSPPHAGNGNKSQKGGRRTHKNKKH